MSQENVQIASDVRRALGAYSRGDFDAAMKTVHPAIEFVPPGGQETVKGAAQFRAWMEPDAFESQMVEPLDIRVVGKKVLVRMHTYIKGAGSGIEADFRAWGVWTYDDAGRQTRIEVYLDHEKAEALEAVGLSEQDAHADS